MEKQRNHPDINIHELKTHPEFFKAVWRNEKPFEVRKDDRDYKVGDKLLLKEWDPETEQYTGFMRCMNITYILRDPNYCKEGFIIMAIGFD